MTGQASPAIAVVLGTRPEIIKLAGLLDELGDRAVLIHTGQHYDEGLSQVFFDSLGLRRPAHQLHLGGGSRADQIGRGAVEVGHLLSAIGPRVVVVQGDTNSALAGALAANSHEIPLVHVEAGLRSFDRAMPEEHNRVLVDHLADLLAAPTPSAVANLEREGISGPSVIRTGNTVVEAVARQLPDSVARTRLLAEYQLTGKGFVLATIHRPENTDDPAALAEVLRQLGQLPLPVLLPLHPRTLAAAQRAGLESLLEELQVVRPLDGPSFLGLACEAALLVSDSGGVQEEVTVLGRPLVVVRRSTERPEAFEHHATLVSPSGIGAAAERYLTDVAGVHTRLESIRSPFGDGSASAVIAREICARFD
ncbi:MAG: UDP-N-acetylglucosamine 2-epimerase (non-hydrolyzing) [Actinomycetota bacterium]|nr:UDP-N-acetylglucosamine 2-epimerase (non-hydrolyzing) [Actinomycetota bacterium]